MRKRMELGRPSHATVVAYIALFVALGGSAYAVKQLPKNSVGTRQLKKNAVKTGDIARNAVKVGKLAKEAVRAGKLARNAVPTNRLRDNAVTGAKVNESTLSTVPSAQTSNSIVPPEGWHVVGALGEPGFENGWSNQPGSFESAAFYKDHEGIVHLRGYISGGELVVFRLPPGYRPAAGKTLGFSVACNGGACSGGTGVAAVYGAGLGPLIENGVLAVGENAMLSGIDFRAES